MVSVPDTASAAAVLLMIKPAVESPTVVPAAARRAATDHDVFKVGDGRGGDQRRVTDVDVVTVERPVDGFVEGGVRRRNERRRVTDHDDAVAAAAGVPLADVAISSAVASAKGSKSKDAYDNIWRTALMEKQR